MFDGDKSLLIKTIVTALLATGVGLAVKKISGQKITFFTAILSVFIGVTIAYLMHDLIYFYAPARGRTITIALIAISGDKIGHYLIFKFKVNLILDVAQEVLMSWIKKK